jgi:hypothetical protein
LPIFEDKKGLISFVESALFAKQNLKHATLRVVPLRGKT